MRPDEDIRIGIGTYDLAPDVCTASVTAALNVGYQHVDTAEMYENEAAVGRAIELADVARDDVFVATKIHSRNLSYEDVLEHADASRDRLGVETIDLLYVHWPIRTYDAEKTLAAFDELYERGEIRNIGVSNFTPSLLDEAMAVLDAPLFALDLLHSLKAVESHHGISSRSDPSRFQDACVPLVSGRVSPSE